MSTVNEEAKKILEDFGEDIIIDLKNSLIAAMRAAGSRNVQEPRLDFSYSAPKIESDGVSISILASDYYWKFIEYGVDGSKKNAGARPDSDGKTYKYKSKMPPLDSVSKKWQSANGIDPRNVLLNIKAKSIAKRRGLNFQERKFGKKIKKTLNIDDAYKSLGFIYQRLIFNRGLKPRPFLDRVLEDGRIEVLSSKLRQTLGAAYKLEIITELNGNNT